MQHYYKKEAPVRRFQRQSVKATHSSPHGMEAQLDQNPLGTDLNSICRA